MGMSNGQQILAGVIQGAKRVKPTKQALKIKPGGKLLGRSAVDWYAELNNVAEKEIRRNSSAARILGLKRTLFCIEGDDLLTAKLRIKEWDAKCDWKKDYRTIWQGEASDFKARKEMMEKVIEKI